mgnify:CR=1 FL=1
MSYCLNPKCSNPSDPKNTNQLSCVNCGSELIFKQRYRVIKPLGKGGCGEVFEVDDNGTTKVLKRLSQKSPKFISLFQQEARVLSRLQHPGIPKVEKDGYFQYQPEGSINQVHCLVMEKIEGVNLAEWLEIRGNKPIGEEDAIAWLLQLIDILEKVHQNQYFHRDIKPCNIMIRSPQPPLLRGAGGDQLVLIDFGSIREMTDTYLAKIGGNKELTSVITAGYTPPEQTNGRPLPQSDFFALGRTFVHLLTGKYPIDFEEDEQLKLLWRDSAKDISKSLADLIDWMMEPSPIKRPQNTEIIRQYLAAWQSGEIDRLLPKIEKEELPIETNINKSPKWRGWQSVIFSSILTTSLVMGVRYMSWLERWELSAFDWLMRMRPGELIDPRILVIEITEDDLNKYVGNKYEKQILRDATLATLIQKLEKYKPLAIGLDLHRYQPRPPGRKDLITILQQNQNILTVCAYSSSDPNYAPLPELKDRVKEKFGFSDLDNDDNGIVRRQVLSYDPSKTSYSSTCTTPYSFSFYLAKRFLQAQSKPLAFNKNGEWYAEKVIFKPLGIHTGGYQTLDGQSNQILVNYRSPWDWENKKIAKNVSLKKLLEEQDSQLKQLVEGKIVFIGHTSVGKDELNTPLGKMPGVWVHAHMTSQILSAVMDKRRLLWVLPQWGDFQWGDTIFIWVWSFASSLIAWRFRSILALILFSGIFTFVLYQVCLVILTQGGWMPLIPSVLSLFSTAVLMIYISLKNQQQKR